MLTDSKFGEVDQNLTVHIEDRILPKEVDWKTGVTKALERLINKKALNKKFPVHVMKEVMDLYVDVQEPFNLLIAGEFKTGKSTFINALLGVELLTSDVKPATAILTKIKYGEEKQLIAHFRNGSKEIFPLDWLGKLTSENEDFLAAKLRRNIHMVEITLPLELLQRVTIIDSPGLEAGFSDHTKMTETFMNRADHVFWVFDFGQVGKQTEMRVLNRFKDLQIPVTGIINKIDMHNPEELTLDEYYHFVKRRLDGKVGNIQGVSSKIALQAKNTGSNEHLVKAFWPELEQLIYHITEDLQTKGQHTYRRLGEILHAITQFLKQQQPMLLDYKTILLPFHQQVYPHLLQAQEERDENFEEMQLMHHELTEFAKSDCSTLEELLDSIDSLYTTYQNKKDAIPVEIFSALSNINVKLEEANEILKMQQEAIVSYEQKRKELDQTRDILENEWQQIKDLKISGMKRVESFQGKLGDFKEQYEKAEQLYTRILAYNEDYTKAVNKAKKRLGKFVKDCTIVLTELDDSICKSWNSRLVALQDKYSFIQRGKINEIAQWMSQVYLVYDAFNQAIDVYEYILQGSYKQYEVYFQELTDLQENFISIQPVLQEFETLHSMEASVTAHQPFTKFELDVNRFTNIDIAPLEASPTYQVRLVTRRIVKNQDRLKKFIITIAIIIIGIYLFNIF